MTDLSLQLNLYKKPTLQIFTAKTENLLLNTIESNETNGKVNFTTATKFIKRISFTS